MAAQLFFADRIERWGIHYAKNQIIMCKACQASLKNAICSAVFKSHHINLQAHMT